MANVFCRQNKMDIADSLYAEVSKTSTHPVSVSLFFFFCALFNVFLFLTVFNMMVTISAFLHQSQKLFSYLYISLS